MNAAEVLSTALAQITAVNRTAHQIEGIRSFEAEV